jgi:hypothetical protein
MARSPQPIRVWQFREPTASARGAAALVAAVLEQHMVRTLGALPLLLPILEQLGLREIVNRHCQPDGSGADLDLGLVTVVLACNRLVAPQPLVHVESWLAQTALPDLLGLDAARCNDDRLARTLDALAPHLEAIWQDLVVRAIGQFHLDMSRLCYDLTSISFCGAYEDAEVVRYGYSRDHRPDCKQVELATTVTALGGIPIDAWVRGGNVADGTTPVANLRRLQRLLALLPPRLPGTPPPLVISDRAMLTLAAIAAYEAAGVHYLGPLDPSLGQGAVRALLTSVRVEELAATPLAYRPRRAVDDPDWHAYQGVPRTFLLPHPDPSQPPLVVHALVVWSPGQARLDAGLRATHLGRLEAALADLSSKMGRRPYTTVTAVERRVAAILAHQPARQLLTVTVSEHPDARPAQRLRLTWRREEDALAAASSLDGRYVLGTNAAELDPEQMLAGAKLRDVPEKRFALTKGPLAVRPVYLHKQERILALVFCTMIALLVFALLELLAHRAGLAQSGTTMLAQFASLSVLVLVLYDGAALRYTTGLAPPLTAILQALGFPPAEQYAACQV